MSNELFYKDKNDKKQDSLLHRELLENSEARATIAKQAIRNAIKSGMHPRVAIKLYKYRGKASPHFEESRADDWWDQLNREEQLLYLKAHPKSIYKNKVKAEQIKPADNDPTSHLKSENFSAKVSSYISPYSWKTEEKSALDSWLTNLPKIDPEKLVVALTGDANAKITKISSNFGNSVIEFNGTNFHADRTFVKDKDGLSVHHDFFKVEEKFQGQNIAKNFLRHSMITYQQLGVKHIMLEANIDVGGYAWARYGFVPIDVEWKNLRLEILQRLKYLHIDDETMQHVEQLLTDTNPATIRKISDLTIPVKIGPLSYDDAIPNNFFEFLKTNSNKTMSLGKALLMQTDWGGKLDLHDKESMDRFNTYVNQ